MTVTVIVTVTVTVKGEYVPMMSMLIIRNTLRRLTECHPVLIGNSQWHGHGHGLFIKTRVTENNT